MKLIFSRKGLDSSFGPLSSAILPDGTLYWIPIPDRSDDEKLPDYSEIEYCGINAGELISELSGGNCSQYTKPHVDPDIYGCYLHRSCGWKAAFGQCDAAQGHLENEGVGVGDIFLYFAWFRSVGRSIKGYNYDKNMNAHIINGWLQIGGIIKPNRDEIPEWLCEHPHVIRDIKSESNTIYIAADELTINGEKTGLPASGYFSKVSDEIILTSEGKSRSNWQLPKWFYPSDGRKPLSYHRNMSRWKLGKNSAMLRTVDIGQEFVLDCNYYPEAAEWLKTLLKSQARENNLCDSKNNIPTKEMSV